MLAPIFRSDLAAVRAQPAMFGTVASEATVWHTFDHHSLLAMCAETDEVLAGILRAGNAGTNTAVNHVVLLGDDASTTSTGSESVSFGARLGSGGSRSRSSGGNCFLGPRGPARWFSATGTKGRNHEVAEPLANFIDAEVTAQEQDVVSHHHPFDEIVVAKVGP